MINSFIRRKFSRAATGTMAVAGLFGVALGVAPAASAGETPPEIEPMGHCGQTFDASVTGASAHWELSCENGKITVDGTLEGTFPPDGMCSKVKAYFASGVVEYSGKVADPWDEVSFHWSHPGKLADVYIYEWDC